MPERSEPGAGMTAQQLAEEVERLRPWFHAIELPHGVWTKRESAGTEPADHPAGTWEVIRRHLPDLAGKSVLDVGCGAGFYSVQAKRLGAARVLGVDARQHEIRQALLVRRALGLDIELRRQSVYRLSPARLGRFDVVLALGLIYHCKHFVLALEKLFSVTGGLLIVETEVLPEPQSPSPINPPHRHDPIHRLREPARDAELAALAGRPMHPLAFVDNEQRTEEAVANWFVPSAGAAAALLRAAGFSAVEVAARFGARALLVGRRGGRGNEEKLALAHFAAEISLLASPDGSASRRYRVAVENTGAAVWRARGEPGTGRGAARLGSHLLRADETEVAWDFAFAALPHDVAPGERAELTLAVEVPGQPGEYVVELDLVLEGIGWFEEGGGSTLRLPLAVGQ
jgi:tRNA (mo5U34)-methyltransferase